MIHDKYEITDIAKFFHGDGPACAIEAGQQKGGRYPCWICPADLNSHPTDIAHMHYLPYLTLKDRSKKVLSTISSQEQISSGGSKLYKKLKKQEIINELHEREIYFHSDSKKHVLEEKLIKEMHGIQRLPLLYNQGFFEQLESYEVLPCEPLHDVKNHIENLYIELPLHLKKEEKKLMEEFISLSFERKETKRGVDCRKSLIKLTIALNRKINDNVYKILLSLCEIQHILYLEEANRTIENILRLHNQILIHSCLLKYVVGPNPKGLSSRCFYGKYFHAIVCHSSIMFRIVSGKSANTEQEERVFNTLKNITSNTSNHHPEHVLLNSIIRLQVREDVNAQEGRIQNDVQKLADGLPKKCNTIIPFWIIDMYEWD